MKSVSDDANYQLKWYSKLNAQVSNQDKTRFFFIYQCLTAIALFPWVDVITELAKYPKKLVFQQTVVQEQLARSEQYFARRIRRWDFTKILSQRPISTIRL